MGTAVDRVNVTPEPYDHLYRNGALTTDGFLVSFNTDMAQDRSECIIVDGMDIAAGPVCTIILPHRISSETQATWASREALRS